jgi:hypothetical protein
VNLYILHLASPGAGPDGVVIYRLGVAAVMAEVRRAHRWGYTLTSLEIA